MIDNLIIVRGSGDIASGTIHRLVKCGFPVLALDTPRPSSIRRHIAFSEAVYDGTATVEGVTAELVKDVPHALDCMRRGNPAVMVDPKAEILSKLPPLAVVDAILAKRNIGTHRKMAPITIALGPGFTAPDDVDAVIETMRGHDLGRIITNGAALPNTGVPGIIGGYGIERVNFAPCAGTLRNVHKISDYVEAGETIAMIDDTPVTAQISGIIRGLIRDGFQVTKGFKIADVDPRKEQKKNCFTISDKARNIAGSVLEAILYFRRVKGI